MKSPKVKGVGEVVTEYGAKVMKVIKRGLLGRSLFDFYGDVKANALRLKESSTAPLTPNDKDGGVVYVKNADGKLYYKSNEVSEVELSAHTVLTTEEVQDIAGPLVATGGTKTGIAVTYQDSTGDVDFVVDHDAATNFSADEHFTQASITTVGTIGTGVWEGTTIKTAFIGDNQVTEDKLADTLLAEIDANTLKNTNVVGDLTITAAGHKLQLNTTNGVDVLLPLATTDAWGVMSDEMFDEHTANNAKNTNVVQTTITGNAGTATALTSGNKTINGDLSITGNIAVDGSNANINLNAGADIVLEADNAGGSGASSIQYLDAGGTGRIILAANSDVAILSNRAVNGTVQIRANTSSAGGGGEVTVATFEDDKATFTVPIISEGLNVKTQKLYVKILPSDFIADDGGRPLAIDDTGSDRYLESHSANPMFASVHIPSGFKATDVYIYGSATSAVTVYEADINSATVTSKGTGNIGTSIDITDVTADTTNYIMIELAQVSGEKVYGGKMTIAAV